MRWTKRAYMEYLENEGKKIKFMNELELMDMPQEDFMLALNEMEKQQEPRACSTPNLASDLLPNWQLTNDSDVAILINDENETDTGNNDDTINNLQIDLTQDSDSPSTNNTNDHEGVNTYRAAKGLLLLQISSQTNTSNMPSSLLNDNNENNNVFTNSTTNSLLLWQIPKTDDLIDTNATKNNNITANNVPNAASTADLIKSNDLLQNTNSSINEVILWSMQSETNEVANVANNNNNAANNTWPITNTINTNMANNNNNNLPFLIPFAKANNEANNIKTNQNNNISANNGVVICPVTAPVTEPIQSNYNNNNNGPIVISFNESVQNSNNSNTNTNPVSRAQPNPIESNIFNNDTNNAIISNDNTNNSSNNSVMVWSVSGTSSESNDNLTTNTALFVPFPLPDPGNSTTNSSNNTNGVFVWPNSTFSMNSQNNNDINKKNFATSGVLIMPLSLQNQVKTNQVTATASNISNTDTNSQAEKTTSSSSFYEMALKHMRETNPPTCTKPICYASKTQTLINRNNDAEDTTDYSALYNSAAKPGYPLRMRNIKINTPHMGELSLQIFDNANEDWYKYFYRSQENKLWRHNPILSVTSRKLQSKPPYFECLLCKHVLTYFSSLMAHLNMHLDVQPFICNLCSNAYNSKASLNRHRKSKHGK